MRVLRSAFLALLPTAAGCATVGMMRELPADAGQLAHYAMAPDSLAAAAQEAVRQEGLEVAEVTRPDSATRVVIATRGSLFGPSWLVRLRVARDTGRLTAVRVVSRPWELMELWPRDRAPDVLRSLDAYLGPEAIGPWPGMRVRLAPSGEPPVIGTVLRLTGDTVVLQADTSAPFRPFAVADLDELAVSRGTVGHAKEGALVGLLLGGLAGAGIGSGTSSDASFAPDLGGFVGAMVGAAVGALFGGSVGSGIRTEVWSEVPRRSRP